jgi:hypothetical protein
VAFFALVSRFSVSGRGQPRMLSGSTTEATESIIENFHPFLLLRDR